MVQIRLLGGVAATADDGVPVDMGTAKCQAVLATLALSVGESVPVSRLVEVVWGEDTPRTAGKTLQGYVADLRKGLG
ncbi:MAG: AfsR/SARP family transcriptional regulator, partial [Nocardioidaceae bacterium]